jgi:hypothetical protein
MYGFRALSRLASGATREERRHTGRLACSDLVCQFGAVVDLSRDGAKVIFGRGCPKIRRGERAEVKFVGVGCPLVLPAEAVWVRRRAFRPAVIGLRFTAMDAPRRLALAELANAAMDRRGICVA